MVQNFRNVKASDLKVGDVIAFTKDKVIQAPYKGIHTPSGKVTLTVATHKGYNIPKTWNSNTLISVLNTIQAIDYRGYTIEKDGENYFFYCVGFDELPKPGFSLEHCKEQINEIMALPDQDLELYQLERKA